MKRTKELQEQIKELRQIELDLFALQTGFTPPDNINTRWALGFKARQAVILLRDNLEQELRKTLDF